jgi:CheY-like chemotaxis protein
MTPKERFDTINEDMGASTHSGISHTICSPISMCTEACQTSDAASSSVVMAVPLTRDFRPRIAVVDGSPRTRQRFARILSGLPYCLAQYGDGADIVKDNVLCVEELSPLREPENSAFPVVPAGNFTRNTRDLSLGEPTCPTASDIQPSSHSDVPNSGRRSSPIYGGASLFNILPTTELIFINYFMPKMNGRDAVKRLRALGVQVPIVVFVPTTKLRDVCKAVGATDVIAGPLTADVIKMMVAKHLSCGVPF